MNSARSYVGVGSRRVAVLGVGSAAADSWRCCAMQCGRFDKPDAAGMDVPRGGRDDEGVVAWGGVSGAEGDLVAVRSPGGDSYADTHLLV